MNIEQKAREEADKVYPVKNDWACHNGTVDFNEDKRKAYIAGYTADKWVSVEDELPKELEALNGIEMPYECRFSCHLEGGLFISDESGDVVNITHWEYASLPPTK